MADNSPSTTKDIVKSTLSDYQSAYSHWHQRDIQLIAFKNTIDPNELSYFRRICRDFCILFHTPLHEVEKFSLEYILLHLIEYEYSKKTQEELNTLKHNLLNDIIVIDNAKEDEDWHAELELIALKQYQDDLEAEKKKAQEKALNQPDIKIDF